MKLENREMRKHENELFEALKKEGIEAESIEVVKNGVICKGIRVCQEGSDVSPIVYYSEQETVEAFLSRVYDALNNDIQSPARLLRDPEYVRDHIYLALQKRSDEEIAKRQYLNLDVVLRIIVDIGKRAGTGSIKVTPGLIEHSGLSEDELWKCAAVNSRKTASIRSMAEVLDMPMMDDSEHSLYIGTAGQTAGGAAILFFPEVFHQFCVKNGETECFMLPSSTEEVIVLRGCSVTDGHLSMSDLVHMVASINAEQVEPILQLTPAVYSYCLDTDDITVVATL